MSTTDSIVSSRKNSRHGVNRTTWTLGLFGTAIGAGGAVFPYPRRVWRAYPHSADAGFSYPIARSIVTALARSVYPI